MKRSVNFKDIFLSNRDLDVLFKAGCGEWLAVLISLIALIRSLFF